MHDKLLLFKVPTLDLCTLELLGASLLIGRENEAHQMQYIVQVHSHIVSERYKLMLHNMMLLCIYLYTYIYWQFLKA